MRFFEFKLPAPGSNLSKEIESKLNQVINIADQNPELEKTVNATLKNLLDLAKKNSNSTKDLPVGEDLTASLSLKDLLLAQLENVIDAATKKTIIKTLDDLIQQSTETGRKQEYETGKATEQEIQLRSTNLAKKISGTLNAFADSYQEQIKEGDPQAPKRTKSDVKEVKEDLVDLIKAIFSKPLSKAKTIEERDVTSKEILDFMKRCETGIIDLENMISRGSGNVLEGISEKDKTVLDMLENALLKAKPSATAGNWGPGELGLAILGTPVHKAGKGDLQIGSMKIELKASQKAKSGGRFGSSALNYGINGKETYENALNELLISAGYKPKEINFKNDKLPNYVGNWKTPDVQMKRGGIKPGIQKSISHLNFGESFVNNALNPKIQNKIDKETTVNFLTSVATSCIIPAYRKKLKTKWIRTSVNSDGTINYNNFLQGYSAMLYDLYQQTDQVEQILVLNPLTGSFMVLNGPEDIFKASKADNPIQYGTTAIDFNDKQGKASPQIGIA